MSTRDKSAEAAWEVVTDGELYVHVVVGKGPRAYDVAQAAASAVARMQPGVTVSVIETATGVASLRPPPPAADVFATSLRTSTVFFTSPTSRLRAPPALTETREQRVRAAYLRVTGGRLNEYVRLAELRAELRDYTREAIDDELRGMQRRGVAVLYPIDDPKRTRPEDDAAALRVLGERRDLFCIKRAGE